MGVSLDSVMLLLNSEDLTVAEKCQSIQTLL